MKIIVCVKCVPSPHDGNHQKTIGIDREKTEQIINPYDLYALEAALEIRDRSNENVHITILSMGPETVEMILKDIYYLGADRIILLTDKIFSGADTLATSYALQKAIEKIGSFDLIICGQQSIDGDTGQVGPILAGNLNIPFLLQVKEVCDITPDFLICKRYTDYESQIIKIPLPTLISIKSFANNPRIANLKDYFKNRNSEVEKWDREIVGADESRCGMAGSATRVVEIYRPPVIRQCEFIEGDSEEIIARLLNIFMEKGFFRNI